MTGPRFRKPRSTGPHYVNNKELYEAMCGYHADREAWKRPGSNVPEPRATEYVGKCIMLICERLSLRPNFIGYAHRDEMIADGIMNCVAAINNFNPEKSKNPFSYFTQIAFNAFIRRISEEKTEQYKKLKNLSNMRGTGGDAAYLDGEIPSTYRRENHDINLFIADFERKMTKPRARKKGPKGLEKFSRVGLSNKY